ncbi:hypothetical protein AYI70_g2564 [Smittium culicis]|uniref:BHLH domain-containing protein n=1 Tax=Smittium culicis TaxID=133412 RepID=A0A1R1Y800_9FUNG|nr:hypothetical protein AYI70_g2564 [Smittium culicis]
MSLKNNKISNIRNVKLFDSYIKKNQIIKSDKKNNLLATKTTITPFASDKIPLKYLSHSAEPTITKPSTSDTETPKSNLPSQASALDKKAKRKISHSAIEKRRREKTNSVLKELQVLVPWLNNDSKFQKLEILENATMYIKQLIATKPPLHSTHDNTIVNVLNTPRPAKRKRVSQTSDSDLYSDCSGFDTALDTTPATNPISSYKKSIPNSAYPLKDSQLPQNQPAFGFPQNHIEYDLPQSYKLNSPLISPSISTFSSRSSTIDNSLSPPPLSPDLTSNNYYPNKSSHLNHQLTNKSFHTTPHPQNIQRNSQMNVNFLLS